MRKSILSENAIEFSMGPADNWDALKNKFPEHLKPVLRAAGVTAMRHDMFGERDEAKGFYMSLPSVLPYNQFTLAVRMLQTL